APRGGRAADWYVLARLLLGRVARGQHDVRLTLLVLVLGAGVRAGDDCRQPLRRGLFSSFLLLADAVVAVRTEDRTVAARHERDFGHLAALVTGGGVQL